MSFNKCILMGRLVANPELKKTQNGVAVTTFTLAVDRKYNKEGEKKSDFITIVAWRQTAEFICRFFLRGSAILVCGELQTRNWTDDNGNKRYATEVVASEVSFAESKKNSETNSSPAEEIPTQDNVGGYTSEDFETIADEALPF